MSRYIDADALRHKLMELGIDNVDVYNAIWDVPTADVVEVVRCKNCRHFELQDLSNPKHNTQWCIINGFNPQGNDYCSYGERREDEQIH